MHNKINNYLDQLIFKNKGVTTKDSVFENRKQRCYYLETEKQWTNISPANSAEQNYFEYLYEKDGDKYTAPPSGIRSSVPLGGLGAGTIELRGDGRLVDWNIFNNSPADGGDKVQLDEALFNIKIDTQDGVRITKCIRTHPPKSLPAMDEIEYSGAFPVSRLKLNDTDIPLDITLHAFCEYSMESSEKSCTPCIFFSFDVYNPKEVETDLSLMFSLPNHIDGTYSNDEALILSKQGNSSTGGDMSMTSFGDDFHTCYTGNSLIALLSDDTEHKNQLKDGNNCKADFGLVSSSVHIKPLERKNITFALSWYFPNRVHHDEILGNYYNKIYSSSMDVAKIAYNRIEDTLKSILDWQNLCFNNDLPTWLQDSMINSLATMYKTSMWFEDGRFRQWESFSCPDVDAIHIHFYRSLPYELFFPDLKKSIYDAYAKGQMEDGYIQEVLGWNWDLMGLHQNIDTANGRIMGDTCTTFILGVYMNYRWSNDDAFFNRMWPYAVKAADWQMKRCEKFGLPNEVNCTYDLSGFGSKDIVAYSAFLHIAAMMAMKEMAIRRNNNDLIAQYTSNIKRAKKQLNQHLWTGKYYRTWWMNDEDYPDAVHVDTLYGQLWANILGLGQIVDKSHQKSHLEMEKKLNDSPYGLKVLNIPDISTDIENPTNNDTTWEAGSLDWSILNIYLNNDIPSSLEPSKIIADKWQNKLNDQWDYKDLATIWDGQPWCNSHYGRQLILWAIPIALSGMQYSAIDSRLAFSPKMHGRIPFSTPKAKGILEVVSDNEYTIEIISGTLDVKELLINDVIVKRNLHLGKNDVDMDTIHVNN